MRVLDPRRDRLHLNEKNDKAVIITYQNGRGMRESGSSISTIALLRIASEISHDGRKGQ